MPLPAVASGSSWGDALAPPCVVIEREGEGRCRVTREGVCERERSERERGGERERERLRPAGAAAVERQHSESGCGGAAQPDGHACPAAFGSSKSAAPSRVGAACWPQQLRASGSGAQGAAAAQQRRERREAAKRTELLAKVNQ